jgi:hypothetical protein
MHFTGHKSMLSIDLLLNQPLPLLILGVFIILAAASEIGFIAGRWIARKFGKAKDLMSTTTSRPSQTPLWPCWLCF